MATTTFTPPYARMREIAFNARNNLSLGVNVGDEVPPEIASTSVTGTSSLAARADHTHGGFDPSNRIADGLYAYRIDDSAQEADDGDTTWKVRYVAGRAVMEGHTRFIPGGTVTLHSESNLLAVGETCGAAIVAELVVLENPAQVVGVLSTPGEESAPPTDEEILTALGHNVWVRIANSTIIRNADEVETPATAPVIITGFPLNGTNDISGLDGETFTVTVDGTPRTYTQEDDDFNNPSAATPQEMVNALNTQIPQLTWDVDDDNNIVGVHPVAGAASTILVNTTAVSLAFHLDEAEAEGTDDQYIGVLDATYDNDAADTGSV